jgi:hypothetical protein
LLLDRSIKDVGRAQLVARLHDEPPVEFVPAQTHVAGPQDARQNPRQPLRLDPAGERRFAAQVERHSREVRHARMVALAFVGVFHIDPQRAGRLTVLKADFQRLDDSQELLAASYPPADALRKGIIGGMNLPPQASGRHEQRGEQRHDRERQDQAHSEAQPELD